MLESHNRTRMVRCSAGVSPAIFPPPHSSRMPAGRQRYEKPAFLGDSPEFNFANQIPREKCGPNNISAFSQEPASALDNNWDVKLIGERRPI